MALLQLRPKYDLLDLIWEIFTNVVALLLVTFQACIAGVIGQKIISQLMEIVALREKLHSLQ